MIRIEGLTKRYKRMHALAGLNLEVPRGSIFGLIGKNGAGKTTTMRILATLLLPTSGRAEIDGYDVVTHPAEIRRRIGFMPDFFGVYDDLKAYEYLEFYAAAQGVPSARRHRLILDLLELVDLSHKKDSYVDFLSRGMKQRLCLARAMVHDPDLLILDEPASGLDPGARIEMRELLKELRNMGKTILISSHILTELADLCTHVGIVDAGRTVVAGSIDDVLRRDLTDRVVRIRLAGGAQGSEIEASLAQLPGVQSVVPSGNQYQVKIVGDDEAVALLLKTAVANGLPIVSFSEAAGNLEELFLHTTANQEGA